MAIVQPTGEITLGVIKDPTPHSVWVKAAWADEWVYVPYLFCDSAADRAFPTIPEARFTWKAGSIIQWDDNVFRVYTPLDLNGWYVKVIGHTRFGDWLAWVGILQVDTLTLGAVNTDGVAPGDQALGAVGIDDVLKRRKITEAYIEGGASFIETQPIFNAPFETGLSEGGNRSSTRNGDGVYTFSNDGDEWTNMDILEYVLFYFQPPTIQFAITGQTAALDQIVERHDLRGIDPYQAVERLVSRRRGLGAKVFTLGEGVAEIFIFSILTDPIQFGDLTLPANQNQDIIAADNLIDVQPRIGLNSTQHYDTIIVEGQPIKTCFSVAYSNFTLEEGWTTAEQTAYEAAEDKERSTDKFDRVFTFYRVPPAFDGSYNSLDDASAQIINPDQLFDGTVDLTVASGFWAGRRERQFLPQLPFPVDAAQSDAAPEFRRPFVVIEDPDTGEYHYVDRLDALDFGEYSLRMADRELGIVVNGRINHQIGLNQFDEIGGAPTDIDPEVDYTTMIATVFLATDKRFRVIFDVGNATELSKTLLIPVDDAEFWWVAPGTVTDVTDGALDYHSTVLVDMVLRDDGARLRAVALAAAAWYSQQRATIEYEFKGLAPFHPIGTLIRAASSVAFDHVDVGTPVTSREFNFETGTMVVRTGYAELDVRAAA